MSGGATSVVLDSKQAPWLSNGPLPRLFTALDATGEETRVVGGAVRNALLGLPVDEIDLATTMPPEEVVRRAKSAGFHPVPTGIEHGTVTVVIDGKPFEVTTLREDVETDGRHAKVRFGRDWQRDAERRDFTMNALFLTRDGAVIDLVGGLNDLKSKRVRFIGDAETRIREDYLRVLRFFRFHAGYGEGRMDRAGLSACIRARDGLASLSRERIRAELLKLLMARHAVSALAAMSETGLLGALLGGVPLLASYSNLVKAEAAAGLPKDPIRHLAALGVFITEDADRLRERLRLANAEHERLCSIGDRWWRISPEAGEHAAKALIYRIGAEHYRDRVLIALARSQAKDNDKVWLNLLTLPERWMPPEFPLKAQRFKKNRLEGPSLGECIKRAEQEWVGTGFRSDPRNLSKLIQETSSRVNERAPRPFGHAGIATVLNASVVEPQKLKCGIEADVFIPRYFSFLKKNLIKQRTNQFGKKSAATIDLNGEPTFAELWVIHRLQKAGWEARWVRNFGGLKFISAWPWDKKEGTEDPVPTEVLERLYSFIHSTDSEITNLQTRRMGGLPDVLAWHKNELLFLECKQARKDRLKSSQCEYFCLAIRSGISARQLGVFEWDFSAD